MPGDARARLLLVGHYSRATGFARVLRGIGAALSEAYDVHVLGLDTPEPRLDGGCTVHPNRDAMDVYAAEQLAPVVDRLRPDAVLILQDFLVVRLLLHRLARAHHRPRTVAYVPIDGPPALPGAVAPLARLDRLVVYTRFAREVLASCVEDLEPATAGALGAPAIVPHGVDTRTFRRLCSPAEARRRLHGPDHGHTFVVLNANRNQPRKRVDLTLQGFARFARGKPPGVRLHLHMGTTDLGRDVVAEARALGIGDRLLLTTHDRGHPAISDERLNLLYNACDVGLNTAVGEGWGLVSVEHAAAGAAQVVPDHSACRELWSGAAELVRPSGRSSIGDRWGTAVDPDDVATALEGLYRDPGRRARVAERCWARATDPGWSWRAVGLQWEEVLRPLVGTSGRSRTRTGSSEGEA